MNGIRLVAVKEYQIDTAYGFIKECTNWLNSKGIPQWRTIYPKEKFLDDIRQEVVYLFTKDEVAVGTVSLYKKPPSYYPDKVFNDNVAAWYVCRLAVSRGRGSRGLGERCLNAISRAAVNNHIAALRLDVAKQNPFLENYYAAQSFQRIALSEIFGEQTVFMEKRMVWSD